MADFYRISDLPLASPLIGDEFVEISQVSTTIRRTSTTLSAQASDNSFNDSGSLFISSGFAVGDRVRVTGFTGNVANNILVGRITALTASKMTIGGTDGDVIVDDAAGESVIIAKWTTRRITSNTLSGTTPTESLIIAVGDETTPLTVGNNKVSFRMPYAFTLTDIKASLVTAQATGSIVTVDVNESGVSILSTKLTFDNTETTTLTAAAPRVISDVSLANDAIITIDIDQVQALTLASGLKITLIGNRV
jgi:hypothetical protein